MLLLPFILGLYSTINPSQLFSKKKFTCQENDIIVFLYSFHDVHNFSRKTLFFI